MTRHLATLRARRPAAGAAGEDYIKIEREIARLMPFSRWTTGEPRLPRQVAAGG
jgi:hypothetical protein